MNMKPFFLLVLIFLSYGVRADRVTVTGKIERLYTYSEQVGFDGDVAVVMSTNIAGCEGGFWLRKADTEGFRNTLSFLLSAFHAGTTVQAGGLNNEIWSGSSSKFCRLDQLALLK